MISSSSGSAYQAARHRAAFLPRVDRGYVVVSGADRGSFLHALLTNDVASLREGDGCYAAFLTPQGRMITDLWVHELGDAVLLRLSSASRSALRAKLDALVFSEDVRLGDVTDRFRGVTVVGPDAGSVLATVLSSPGAVEKLSEHGCRRTTFGGGSALVVQTDELGVPGYELVVEADHVPLLVAALAAAGAIALDVGTAELLRIEGGVPKFHQDMDEETIPLEAGIEGRAISLTKGCYVGQEVIIRVLHRGHGRVARRLVGLVCDSDTPPGPGTSVGEEGQAIGVVTSSALSPTVGRPIALAYVRRDSAEPGRKVTLGDGADGATGLGAVVTGLPFVPVVAESRR